MAAGDAGEGTWTTVVSRRAQRQERARLIGGLIGTACGATRKAAAARAAAKRRTVAAILDYMGGGE